MKPCVHWLIPANSKFYDVFSAYAQTETYWPMNAKISVGDIVYIYLAAPHKQIAYRCDVVDTGYKLEEIMSKIQPFIKGDGTGDKPAKPFMKLKVRASREVDENSILSLQYLRQNGLNGMLMGARKLENNPPLLNYIREIL